MTTAIDTFLADLLNAKVDPIVKQVSQLTSRILTMVNEYTAMPAPAAASFELRSLKMADIINACANMITMLTEAPCTSAYTLKYVLRPRHLELANVMLDKITECRTVMNSATHRDRWIAKTPMTNSSWTI
jgi:hypothetical protein